MGDKGCEHISKADWKNLTHLDLHGNKIGNLGCEYISKANWKNLQFLSLYYNNGIGPKGC